MRKVSLITYIYIIQEIYWKNRGFQQVMKKGNVGDLHSGLIFTTDLILTLSNLIQ